VNLSEIKQRLSELGVSPKRSLGQNFLTGEVVVSAIIQRVSKFDFPSVIEIGPGLGSLTERLIPLDKTLTLIELDRKFCEFWRSRGLAVIEGDALRQDWESLLSEPTVLVSNLPYQISSSLVIDSGYFPETLQAMVLMFQKEVAQRITASASSGDYGLLSVIAQTYWDTSKLIDAGASQFYPPPKVASRVLVFQRKSNFPKDNRFLSFVKQAFSQRRKKLIKNLNSLSGDFEISLLRDSLGSLGFGENCRAEELSPEDFQTLFRSLCKN
jgi:16S rRNA (adenine1518-N6/adenine1519-N6)-dimethyltransferase